MDRLWEFLVSWLLFRSHDFGRQKPMTKVRQDSQLENVICLKTNKQVVIYVYVSKNWIKMGEQRGKIKQRMKLPHC